MIEVRLHFGSLSMETLTARFDGKVFVPDEPIDLPTGVPLKLSVEVCSPTTEAKSVLEKLAELAEKYPATGLPEDGAAEHDHYLYGTPKGP